MYTKLNFLLGRDLDSIWTRSGSEEEDPAGLPFDLAEMNGDDVWGLDVRFDRDDHEDRVHDED